MTRQPSFHQEPTPLTQSRKKAILGDVQKKRRQRTITSVVIVALLVTVLVVGIYAFTRPRNEEIQPIPGNIGTSPCLRPLHTHDGSGQLHVEPMEEGDIIVGDFFLVWGKVFNSSGIFRSSQQLPPYLDCLPSGATPAYHDHHSLTIIFKRDAPSTITMTVNGTPEPLLQNYVFPKNPAAANIVITYGPAVPAQF